MLASQRKKWTRETGPQNNIVANRVPGFKGLSFMKKGRRTIPFVSGDDFSYARPLSSYGLASESGILTVIHQTSTVTTAAT